VTPIEPKGKAIPTDVPGKLPMEPAEVYPSTLPPFLNEQIRHREAYLTLIRDLTEHLAQDWSSKPEAYAKGRIAGAISESLSMWI
jgi:hypothetical protein